jgi:hypothetical protein
MTFCAQYGNVNSFYGNIEYGAFSPAIYKSTGYGAWPDKKPLQKGMLNNIPTIEAPIIEHREPDDLIKQNITTIKNLRAELELVHDVERRQRIRAEITKARAEKDRQFRLKAMIDEEETMFILLH